MALGDLFGRRRREDSEAISGSSQEGVVHPTKALSRFLKVLISRPQPLLLDLGPVIGPNVSFFGEELGCKILVENLFHDLDRHVRAETLEQLPAFFETRLTQEEGTVDGVLCWDLFDYLDRPAAQVLVARLTSILRPGGVLLAFFGTAQPLADAPATYTRYLIVDEDSLRHRVYPAARERQRPILNRDVQRLFEPLTVSEQFLLMTDLREVLFRKASDQGEAQESQPRER